jgi:hypothetical protein
MSHLGEDLRLPGMLQARNVCKRCRQGRSGRRGMKMILHRLDAQVLRSGMQFRMRSSTFRKSFPKPPNESAERKRVRIAP